MTTTEKFVLAIDQGTTSTRAIVFDAALAPVAAAQQEFTQHYPAPGWVEHDAEEIWRTVVDTVQGALGVIHQLAPAVRLEDVAHADHAVHRELRRAQRAHAASAEHRHPGIQRRQQLVVPDGGLRLEDAIHQGNGPRTQREGAPHIPLARGRQHPAGRQGPGLFLRHRGAEEDDEVFGTEGG